WRHIVVPLDGRTGALEGLNSAAPIALDKLELSKSRGVSWNNLRAIRKLVDRIDPDILCTYNWGSIEVAFANRLGSRRAHIHFEDGFGPEEKGGTLPRRDYFRRIALGGHTRVIAPSHGLAEIARHRWRIPNNRLHLFPNGVDTQRFSPAEGRRATGTYKVGFIGALRPEKNLPRLFTAVDSASSQLALQIYGAGPLGDDLNHLADTIGVPIEFFGNTPEPEKAYKNFDIFALTSDTEQMPLTVLEAMASGCAVVATDVGDIRSMVSDENRGFIVPLNRAETALPAAIDALAHDGEKRARIGRLNRERAIREFSLEAMIARYEALFDDLTGARGA
ncbi:MAG: glycosyltransferase family 4 protein, partial [Parvularcula sp.]